MTKYISQTDTNKLIRAALKAAFPETKFSVTGSGGNASNVRWEDGPDTKSVEAITNRYEGQSFDGMTDMASNRYDTDETGEVVHYGATFVFTNRVVSMAAQREATELIQSWGVDVPASPWTYVEMPWQAREMAQDRGYYRGQMYDSCSIGSLVEIVAELKNMPAVKQEV